MNNNEKVFPYKTTIEIDCDPWTGMGRQQDHYEHICIIKDCADMLLGKLP